MRPSFEELIARGSHRRERVEVLEHRPAPKKVAANDLVRRDQPGRTVVGCPKGCVPPTWLRLTDAERDSLVDPPPPVPTGTMRPSPPFGFRIEGSLSGS